MVIEKRMGQTLPGIDRYTTGIRSGGRLMCTPFATL